MTVKRAIVLAAGRGSRLVDKDGPPKPLKCVGQVPLLVRILRTLQLEGIREAVIVIGDRGQMIRDALEREPSIVMRLRFVFNPEFDKNNGVSLLAASRYIDEPCLLTMADHLYSPEIVRRLQEMDLPASSCALAVDHDIERCFDVDDATKVALDASAPSVMDRSHGGVATHRVSPRHRRIARIGKQLAEYDCLDTGVFRIGPPLMDKLETIYAQRGDCSLSDAVAALAAEGRMLACDVGDARWIDVDTPEAAQRAEAMLHVFGDALGDEPEATASLDPAAMELFAPSWVRAVEPYNENHFALAEQRTGIDRMMSNESPFSPSARVLDAIMSAAMGSNRYPGGGVELRSKLAAREAMDASQVLLGAGSAELIDLVVRTFVGPGEEVLISVPTFSMYEARTRTVGGIPVMVPMREDNEFDVPALIGAITERTKLVFLCTPNNPTGNVIPEAELRRVLGLGLPTVVDEAYVELARGNQSFARLVSEYRNLIILRTFSKAFGLAGIRVGYALSHPVQIALLSRVKVPWNLSALAIAAACAAIDDVAEQDSRVGALRQGRDFLERRMARLSGVVVIPSEANFVLLDVTATGVAPDDIVSALFERGMLVRSLDSHRVARRLVRITVGDAAQNRRCADAFEAVLGTTQQVVHPA
jgi:histidinol-phosphate aminotransferase